jgi:hypothetical protein
MKTFYRVTFLTFALGLAILCCYAPWTVNQPVSGPNGALTYAPLWSHAARAIPGAQVDTGAFSLLTGVVAFFAIVIGASVFFFRDNRGPERSDT